MWLNGRFVPTELMCACLHAHAHMRTLMHALTRAHRSTTHLGVMHDFYLRMEYEQSDGFWADLSRDLTAVFGSTSASANKV